MIRPAYEIDLIRRGRKTTIRRRVDPRMDSIAQRTRVVRGRTQAVTPAVPRVGETEAVYRYQGADVACRVVLTSVRREAHGEITYSEVKAEGYGNLEHYVRHWLAEHDRPWLERRALDGAVVEQPAETAARLTWAEVEMRWRCRWADRQVWVIGFELAESALFLATRLDEVYVTNPAQAPKGEAEVLSPADMAGEQLNAEQRAEQLRLEREWERRILSLEQRITTAVAAGRTLRVDVDREARKAMWLRDREAPAGVVEASVRKLEAKVALRSEAA